MLLTDTAQLKSLPKKIISLVPSITELLHHLELEQEVIAITKFCIHPVEWFRNKPKIGGTKNIHIKRIKELQPDLVIASKEENEQEQVEELAAAGFNIWLTDVKNARDAFEMIKDIGTITGKIPEAKKLLTDLKREFGRLPVKNTGIKTAYLIWRNPYMTVGGDSFVNDMLQLCGLENAFNRQPRYPKISIEDIRDAGCILVLLSTEPYPFKEKHMQEFQQQLPGAKVLLADGEMFSWYGSRMLKMPQYFLHLLNTVQSQ